MNTSHFTIHTIDPAAIERARHEGIDVHGNPVESIVARGGEPVRCCLTDALPGDELVLFGYRPTLPAASPYIETGAVFIHAADCGGRASHSSYPADWLARPQVLRAYDERGWIHPSTTRHDGTNAQAALAAVLAHDGVVEVHSRNIDHGCFMFSATATATATATAESQ